MINLTKTFTQVGKLKAALAISAFAAIAAFSPNKSHAALKCEEIQTQRQCMSNEPRSVEYSAGRFASVNPPVLDGFDRACWSWNRMFQCIETEPNLSCQSGAEFAQVKQDCNLTQSIVNASITIRGIRYITDATYTYRCAFGEFTTDQKLPVGKDCAILTPADYSFSNYVPVAPAGANPSAPPSSANPSTAQLTDKLPMTEHRVDDYVCYDTPVTTCSDTCYEHRVNAGTGEIEQVSIPCGASVTQCVLSSDACQGTHEGNPGGGYDSFINVGPDGRCVASEATYTCQSGQVPKCLNKENCELDKSEPVGVQNNGVAFFETQTYICSNETKSCGETTTISACLNVNAWGWDDMQIKNQVGQGLGEVNQAMAKIEGIEKGINKEDLHIFSGQDLRCSYAVGNFLNTVIMTIIAVVVTFYCQPCAAYMQAVEAAQAAAAVTAAVDAVNSKAFGGNCCKDLTVEGSEKSYKLGKCTDSEIKLSVAKKKGLAHYLGEYCSKRGGFPIKQCVEKSRTYCVFDDMLAYVVNEQGRNQLNELASRDIATTSASNALPMQLFAAYDESSKIYQGVLDNGGWKKAGVFNKSQVWYWQYPGYCQSTSTQAAAYELWNMEVNGAADTKGVQPELMNEEESLKLFEKLNSLTPFQECASSPGRMSFMTCSKSDDSCDPSKLPANPLGDDIDYLGEVSEFDAGWTIQEIRTFFEPGDYGVTQTLPSQPNYASVASSLNENVSVTGSCKTNGSCYFSVLSTDKTVNNGSGARARVQETARFPLYTLRPNSAHPAINYIPKNGTLSMDAYLMDPNRGAGDFISVHPHRFIFHPHYAPDPKPTDLHSHFLMEHAAKVKTDTTNPADDYKPLMVPITLPKGTAGWYPHYDEVSGKSFYLSGSCDPNSRWCNYLIESELEVNRHPWGTAQNPRCWGFTVEQLAALDFDKMDLSKWINSLNLDQAMTGMSDEAKEAMAERTMDSASAFYGSIKNNETVHSQAAGTKALVLNSNTFPYFSGGDMQMGLYTVEVALPTNWPAYNDHGENLNPTTNVMIDFGIDGIAPMPMVKMGDGRAWYALFDYGDVGTGRYKVTVTLDTKDNGPQALSTYVAVQADNGAPAAPRDFDFENHSTVGNAMAQEKPAQTLNGINQAPDNLINLSPGYVDMFDKQGDDITRNSAN